MYRLVSLIAFIAIFTSMSQAQSTHIVDLAGTGDFTSIHEAVDAASAGDTIRVQPDQYAFTADLGPVEVDKRLVIIGSGYMPVEEGGTELVDVPGTGFFDLTASADGTVIRGFRVQDGTDFIDTESGTNSVVIEENLFIGGNVIIQLEGTEDTVRSNIFFQPYEAVRTNGTNTKVLNNIFSKPQYGGQNSTLIYIGTGTGVKVANNLIMNGDGIWFAIRVLAGAPEIYSNGFVNNSQRSNLIAENGSSYIAYNAFDGNNINSSQGLSPVTEAPDFTDFDPENSILDVETIDEGSYDLTLADGSGWIDTGRTGTPYLDTDGSRSDIGIYGGPRPFSDGRGAPSVPVVIEFQVTPTTVSPTGTITITATGRIGDN